MHMLGILIFMTAAYQHNIARANGFCKPPTQAPGTVPVNGNHPVNAIIRIQCAEGYMRKAGTSNLIQCIEEKTGNLSWHSDNPLQCIRFCKPPTQAPNTVPVNGNHPVNAKIRIQCAEGYMRKAGTSNLIQCIEEKTGNLSWHSDVPLQCIRFCEPPTQAPGTVPVNGKHPVNAIIRIQCAEGYVRKAGTSNLIQCIEEKTGNISWHSDVPLQCILDPKKHMR